MEHTGEKNRIHLSNELAELLQMTGKHHWISNREDKVEAKGKGVLTTYWLETKAKGVLRSSAGSTCSGSSIQTDDRTEDRN